MIDYKHPQRGTSRLVPAGQTVVLRRGESVTLTASGARLVTTGRG